MTMNEEEWEALDRKELGTIHLFLHSSMAFNIYILFIIISLRSYFLTIGIRAKRFIWLVNS